MRLMVCFWAALATAASGARAAGPDEVLTTDTPEYCQNLHTRVLRSAEARPPSPPIEVLTREGAAMCNNGQVRAGVLRLRRALLWEREGRPD